LTSTLVRNQEVGPGVEHIAARSEIPPPSGKRPAAGGRRSLRRFVFSEGILVFLIALGVYLTVAVLLDFKYHTFSGDAVSRMANGFYILYSRDRHLAAVGFVWEPLQSIADMVFLLGNHLWPALSHNDMAGSLVSALAMAGAVHQIRSALREWGVSRIPRLVLAACFAVDPMILYYGGNGMSEGLYLFTLVASARYLMRWMRDRDLRSLAYAGVALGFSYLTRNEAALAAMAGGVAVLAVSYWRTDGPRRSRVRTAVSDCVIFGIPSFVAAAGWAIISFVITGHFFEQISSIYGNSEQERHLVHKTFHGRVIYEINALEALATLLPLVLVLSILLALKRRDPRMLAPLAVLGGALGFDMLAYLANNIEDYLRYWIVVIPLEVLLVGSLVAALQTAGPGPVDTPAGTRSPRPRGGVLGALGCAVLVLALMIPSGVKTASAMLNINLGYEETTQLGFIFHAHPNATDRHWQNAYAHVSAMDRYLAGLHLPDGDVVVDNSSGCVPQMLTTIEQPKLFVIPNDRDFQRILADPISFHTHYIMEEDPATGGVTAVNLQYPNLWTSGAGFTKMVHEFPAGGNCDAFRLFRVLHHSGDVG
jgi:hypothetical protein